MSKGSIYWDENSRGYNDSKAGTVHKRGRWVGEKNVHGRRIRMRSTDLKKVMEWMNRDTGQWEMSRPPVRSHKKERKDKVDVTTLKPIVGMPYFADVQQNSIYNRHGHKMHARKTGRGGELRYSLTVNSQQITISAPKLMYSAIHDIDPLKIPDSLVVKHTDEGEFQLMHRGDCGRESNKALQRSMMHNIGRRLSERIYEAQILQRYYDNGDTSEVITYAMQQTDKLVAYVRRKYSRSEQRSMDVASEAVEWFCDRIMQRGITVTSVTSTLRGKVRGIMEQHHRMRDISYYQNLT